MKETDKYHLDTKILHGKNDAYEDGTVNPAVQHASTLIAPDYLSFIGKKPWAQTYGRYGLKTHRALEEAVNEIENAHDGGTILTSSGMHAVTLTITSLLGAGDHLLIVDSIYHPVRAFAEHVLTQMNIAFDYYHPLATPQELESLLKPNTKMLYMESPGSGTFEFQDTVGLATWAKSKGLYSALDNSWGVGIFHKPLDLGCDVSIIAGTKYISGHSDMFLGTVSTGNQEIYQKIWWYNKHLGYYVSPDEAYLGLRGIRTLAVRLSQHQENARTVLEWLKSRDEVGRILHPFEENHFGKQYFLSDFTGDASLFGFYLKTQNQEILQGFFDNLKLFKLGYSWGGYESLITPYFPNRVHGNDLENQQEQMLVRIYVGLENKKDLLKDLANGFKAFEKAGR